MTKLFQRHKWQSLNRDISMHKLAKAEIENADENITHDN
jgi:hypothetical protein